jgi:hypothetical protein
MELAFRHSPGNFAGTLFNGWGPLNEAKFRNANRAKHMGARLDLVRGSRF